MDMGIGVRNAGETRQHVIAMPIVNGGRTKTLMPSIRLVRKSVFDVRK
jgi:hypothetical protein